MRRAIAIQDLYALESATRVGLDEGHISKDRFVNLGGNIESLVFVVTDGWVGHFTLAVVFFTNNVEREVPLCGCRFSVGKCEFVVHTHLSYGLLVE